MDACRLCGSSEWEVGGEHDCCEECSMYIAPEMVRLGLSIRRFVRACEVEGLRLTVSAAGLNPREWSALDRLAQLAMEGHGDG